jgi:nitrate/TMAO reductase-like tetraheme cytochrome c subunit
LSAHADGQRAMVRNKAYQSECGACHVAYPPQFLSAASWRAVMEGLPRHFGSDASLDPAVHAEILRYLEAHAGRRDPSAGGKPQLRISETRWFVHEHSEELPKGVWKSPAVKSAANCAACHTAADKGDYSERSLRLPKGANK